MRGIKLENIIETLEINRKINFLYDVKICEEKQRLEELEKYYINKIKKNADLEYKTNRKEEIIRIRSEIEKSYKEYDYKKEVINEKIRNLLEEKIIKLKENMEKNKEIKDFFEEYKEKKEEIFTNLV